jgi:nardilysin
VISRNNSTVYLNCNVVDGCKVSRFLTSRLADDRYLFEARKQEAAEIMTIEKKDVVDFFTKYFVTSSPSCRKLSIHVWGGNAKAEKGEKDALKGLTVIDDLSAFKAKKELYP